MIASVQRADQILDLFSTDVPSWSVTEMAQELDLSKSIIWEYAKTLVSLGILRQDGTNRYRLGWRTFQLGLHARMTSEIAMPARREIHSLANELQETVQLSTRHRDKVIFLEKTVPAHGIRLNATRVGERLPVHTTASGKILISTLSPQELAELFPEETLPQSTSQTLRNLSQLQEQLTAADRDGFAVDNAETIEGIACIGAPVTSRHGDIAWALSMTFHSYKSATHADPYQSAIKDAAQRLSLIAQGFAD